MGMRARLKGSYMCSALTTGAGRAVCRALQKYGAIVADVGSGWFLTGAGRGRGVWEGSG